MYLRNRWTTYPGGAAIVGQPVTLHLSSTDAQIATQNTDANGWAAFTMPGSSGLMYQQLIYGGDTRRVYGSTSGQRRGLFDGEFGSLLNVFENGVVGPNDLQVTPVAGMVVKVGPGLANAEDNMFSSYENTNFTITANTSGVTRFDYIYVEISTGLSAEPYASRFRHGAGEVGRAVVEQIAGNDNRYLIMLAKITVANGVTSITAPNIGDERVFIRPVGTSGSMFTLVDVNETANEMTTNDSLAWDDSTNKFRRYRTNHLRSYSRIAAIVKNATRLGPTVSTPRTVRTLNFYPNDTIGATYDISFGASITLRASPNSGVIDLKVSGSDGIIWSRRCTTNGNVSLPYDVRGYQENVTMSVLSTVFTATLTATWISGDGSFIDEGQLWIEAHPRMVGTLA